ncbi:MAG: hypothetical protein HY758_08730, partial [Nitrospirae bacterium]|nr:hypothetical protein [Nitrospirota bacterium]
NGIGDTNRPHYYDSYPFMYSYGWECYGILSKYPVKNSNLSAYYYKLQTAYNAAGNGNIIQARDIIFPESSGLVINRPVSVTLRLGFDDNNCAYLTNSGTTILKGNMTVSSGALTINSGVLGIE